MQLLYLYGGSCKKKKSAKTLPLQDSHGHTLEARAGQTSNTKVQQKEENVKVSLREGYISYHIKLFFQAGIKIKIPSKNPQKPSPKGPKTARSGEKFDNQAIF